MSTLGDTQVRACPHISLLFILPMKDNYVRNIILDKVVDWDTVHIICDLWFDVWKKMKVRLARINCPEKNTEKWKEVKEYMKQFEWESGSIESLKYDKYWRWLCELYIHDENISDKLLTEGYALPRDGKWEEPI